MENLHQVIYLVRPGYLMMSAGLIESFFVPFQSRLVFGHFPVYKFFFKDKKRMKIKHEYRPRIVYHYYRL